MAARQKKPDADMVPLIDDLITSYRETVCIAAYERLIKCLTGEGMTAPDVERACQIAHMIKEMGMV